MTDKTESSETESTEIEPAESKSTDAPSKVGSSKRSFFVGLILLSGLAVALNAPYPYQSLASRGGTPDTEFDFKINKSALGNLSEAGWPLRYYVRHDFDDDTTYSQWFPTAGVIDIALAAGCIFLACWYLRRQSHHRSKRESKTKSRRVALSLSDLLVIIALIALPMGYWQRQSHLQRVDNKIQQQLASKAVIYREVSAPSFLRDRLPNLVTDTWSRIARVEINEPTDEDIEAIVRLPYLKSLRIGGGEYDLKHLRRLPAMRYLVDLRIAGREIDAATVKLAASCPLVSQLNVAQTNVAGSALGEFESMRRLKKLMAFGTGIDYQAWQDSQLKETLQELRVSRPDTGQSGETIFRGWPNLTHLALMSHDGFSNRNVFDITVADLPKLEHLEIDVFQFIDLKLENLPKLTEIDGGRRNQDRRVADGERAPSFLWTRNIRLKNVPLLTTLQFYCDGFESIEIEGCDGLEKLMGTSMSQLGSEDFSFDYTLDKKYRQNLVDAFGKLSGPMLLGLYGHRLDDLDLSKLAGNKAVRALDFNSSVLSNENIDAIADMKELETFGFYKSRMNGRVVGRINKLFPKLKFLALHERTTAIRLEDKPNLEQITFDDYEESSVSALRLMNVPQLSSPLIVNEYGQYCVVENAPAMKGLAILGTIPTTKLSGVPGLTWFVGGGATLSDPVVKEVLKATDLKQLTMAYPAAGKESFSGLLQLKSLTELIVPAAPLDDAAMQQWDIPPTLTDLNLNDCNLSAKTIDRIFKRGRWFKLSVAGNELSPDSLASLSDSPVLARLSLGRVTLQLETIKSMPELPSLMSLGLSGSTLGKGVLTEINKKYYRLTEMNLEGATFDNNDLMALIRANPKMKFKLGPTDANVQIITYLTSSDRLIRPQDPWAFKQRSILGYDAAGRPHYVNESENRTEFERPDLDLSDYQLASSGPLPGGPAPVVIPGNIPIDVDASNADSESVIGKTLELLLGGNRDPATSDEQTSDGDDSNADPKDEQETESATAGEE